MATERVGGVEYTVDADTGQFVASVREVDAAAKKMEESFARIEKQTNDFTAALKRNGSTIASNGVVIDKTGKINERATAKLRALTAAQNELSEKSGVASGRIGAFGRQAGQAGIQIQQFVGQIQGGQSAMLALSQQGADLGFVLGMPLAGAIIGIGASIASFMLPNLLEGENAMSTLAATTERVNEVMKMAANGNLEFTDTVRAVARTSEAAARAMVSLAIADQIKAQKEAVAGLKDALKEVEPFFGTTFGGLASEIGISRQELGALNGALSALSRGVDTEALDMLESALLKNNGQIRATTTSGKEMTRTMLALLQQMRAGDMTITQAREALSGLGIELDSNSAKVDDLVGKLRMEEKLYGATARAIALETASRNGATQAQFDEINKIFDVIEKKDDEAEARKKNAAEIRAEAEAEKAKNNAAQSFVTGIIQQGETPEQREARQMARLNELREQGRISAQQHEDALTAIAKKGADDRAKESERSAENQMQAQMALASSVLSSVSAITQGLMQSMDEQSGAYKVMFAIQKSAAIAQAIVAAELAAATILARDVGIFGLGAVASSNLVRGLGYASAGVIAGTAIAGGREMGGPVQAGKLYEVGERNRPELFVSGGRQFMIPGNSGAVVSNKDMMAGGATVPPIIIQNLPGQTAEVSQQGSGMDAATIVRIVAQDMRSRGQTFSAMTSVTSAQNKIGNNGRR